MKAARRYLRAVVLLCATSVFADMTSSSNPALVGQPVVFTMQINAPSGVTVAATGSVTLADGGTTIGTAVLQNGIASITATFAEAGDHSISTSYSGDQNFQPSTTAQLLERITVSDAFTLAVTPSTLNQHAGGMSDVRITAFANGSSSGSVRLSCENLPPGVSCSFVPSMVQPTADGQTTTMTITSAGSQVVALTRTEMTRALALIWPAMFGGLFMATPLRKCGAGPLLFGGVCLFAALSIIGCGSTLKIIQGGTPAGSYMVRIVATDGSFTQSTDVQLNIAQ